MGTFSISAQKTTSATPKTFSVVTSDANIDAVAVAYAASYFPLGVLVTPASADGKTAAVYRAPTTQEVFDAAGAGIWAGVLANANAHRRRMLMETAMKGVVDIL